jgi:hypothetical protein
LFNIMHHEKPGIFLKEACRILEKKAVCAIIHWRKDVPTPRGPLVEARPDRKSILEISEAIGFRYLDDRILEPYHWGIRLEKR